MTTAREWQEAADEARELAEDPAFGGERRDRLRDLLHRSAVHFEIEGIKALFAERAEAEKGELP